MRQWVVVVAMMFIGVGMALVSLSVLFMPSATFAQEEEQQGIGGGGGGGAGALCSGRVRCDRSYPNWNVTPCCSLSAGQCLPQRFPYCLNDQGQVDACGNPNPGLDSSGLPLNCIGCGCRDVSANPTFPICECSP
ncbi:MAG: hypothetical protein KatS3mg110_1450 [Pirellulaceae bacterium]|nr:MAG: hypothetical protein KatS3mg110_1450 [Pirellulaceae bacterium]